MMSVPRKVTAMWAMTMLQQSKDPFGIKREEIKRKRSGDGEFQTLLDKEIQALKDEKR
jgi:hypothetical protein